MISIIDKTKQGLPVAALVTNDQKFVLKAYPNEAGTKLRIIIPSLVSFKQVLINIDTHYLEVDLV